jgi:hypothetical protein
VSATACPALIAPSAGQAASLPNDPSSGPFRFPEGWHGTGELRYVNELPVLTAAGTPEEIGAAVGVLAMQPAPRMLGYPEDVLREYSAGWLHRPLARLGEGLVGRLPGAYRRELEAMIAASGVERRRLVVGNTLFDIKKILACSALLLEGQRSGAAGPLMGRNLDYPAMGYAHEHSLVTVYRPRGKRPFAAVGFPGLVGCLSGMNDAGLCVAILEVFQPRLFTRRLDLNGTPYAVCIRRLLEECSTVEEARAALASMRRTTVFNLAVADRRRVAAFEVTTRRVLLRPAQEGACVCTNHFCADELRPLWQFNTYGTLVRHAILRRAVRQRRRFAVADVHAAMHAASNAEETLQTMVFDPAGLRLHLALGTCPASAGPLRTLELAPLFAERN